MGIMSNQLFLLFFVIVLGYIVGRVKVNGVSLGAAGILLVAMVFGHLGFEIDSIVQNIGIACFVTSVGFMAGPSFLNSLKGKAKAYALMGAIIISSSVFVCLLIVSLFQIPLDMSVGLLAGALTTTPGLAAGIEATGSEMVSVGYGIAYPFGVVSVVLFVQIIPKLFYSKLSSAKINLVNKNDSFTDLEREKYIKIDNYGIFSLAMTIVFGFLIGQVKIPLFNGGTFSLGLSGGPLFAGIFLGIIQHIGPIDLKVSSDTLKVIRELGLAFFLAGAGTHAGRGFVSTLTENGVVLFVYGAIMAIVPLIVGYTVARKLLKLDILDTLSTICGGMTSTPALGALINTTGTDDVASAYVATYPFALMLIVVVMEVIGTYWG